MSSEIPNTSKGPRKKTPDVDQRKNILDAAKILFRQRGYQGVSMNDIVEACGFKKPTIYHYFGDKEGIFTEVMLALLIRGREFITQKLKPELTLKEKLCILAEGYYRNSPTSLMAMLRDTGAFLNTEHRQRLIEAFRDNMVFPLEQVFEEAIQEGLIANDVPSDHLAMMYLTLLDAINTQKIITEGRKYDFENTSQDVIKVFYRGLQRISN